MAKIRNDELVQMNGEVLPERTVLSALPMDGGSGGGGASIGCNVGGSLTQSNGVAGSILGFAAGNNQCGLSNTGTATGLSIGDVTLPAGL
jgi:hypothetical protein